MYDPEKYTHINHLQRFGAQQALHEFGSAINWRSDGRDSILDAGCGPGDVTVDILVPTLPGNFSRLVGVDVSEQMIDYSRNIYASPKLSFELFDLDKELDKQPFRDVKPFDHIFSFYVLMWIGNLETCIRNFYKLLVPNGDMLLVYVNHPVFDASKEQYHEGRWAKYMSDLDQRQPPFMTSKNVEKEFCDLVINQGFADCEVRIQTRQQIHKNPDSLREFLKGVSPFLDRLPAEDREPFMDDLMQKIFKRSIRPDGNGDKDTVIVPYNDVMIYAKK